LSRLIIKNTPEEQEKTPLLFLAALSADR